MGNALEFRRTSRDLAAPLAEFFREMVDAGDDRTFHPHPLTLKEAEKLSEYDGDDLYYVIVNGNKILGYGMLRGWDEGYSIPSLGIAIGPSARGTGLSRPFMHFLHAAARQHGASKVRLKVYRDNTRAIKLYETLGYTFSGEEPDQVIGILRL